MTEPNIKYSKFLSFILRHRPDEIGLVLDPEGWAEIQELITKSNIGLTPEIITDVVKSNDKKRFTVSGDGLFIRAAQGHSIEVNLELEAIEPPEHLYHGTATRFMDSIQQSGLQPQNRQYVHLSKDEETAIKVAKRHGKPVVLNIEALKMYEQGHRFYLAENGVWLTDQIPVSFFKNTTYQD